MTDSRKKNQSQDKPKNAAPTDLQKRGWPAPDKAEGEREEDVDEDEP